jgi:hypothetical protein
MAMYNSERQIGDDGDSLTEMNEVSPAESFSHDDARCQRNVSHIREVFDQRTYIFQAILEPAVSSAKNPEVFSRPSREGYLH